MSEGWDEIHTPSSHCDWRPDENFSLGSCISPDWWEMQPSNMDSSMKLIRKGGPTLMYYHYTRTKPIPEKNEWQQPYEHVTGPNICVSGMQWEVAICARNPNFFVQSWKWIYHRKPSWWLKPEPHHNIWKPNRYEVLDVAKPWINGRSLHLNCFSWNLEEFSYLRVSVHKLVWNNGVEKQTEDRVVQCTTEEWRQYTPSRFHRSLWVLGTPVTCWAVISVAGISSPEQ